MCIFSFVVIIFPEFITAYFITVHTLNVLTIPVSENLFKKLIIRWATDGQQHSFSVPPTTSGEINLFLFSYALAYITKI